VLENRESQSPELAASKALIAPVGRRSGRMIRAAGPVSRPWRVGAGTARVRGDLSLGPGFGSCCPCRWRCCGVRRRGHSQPGAFNRRVGTVRAVPGPGSGAGGTDVPVGGRAGGCGRDGSFASSSGSANRCVHHSGLPLAGGADVARCGGVRPGSRSVAGRSLCRGCRDEHGGQRGGRRFGVLKSAHPAARPQLAVAGRRPDPPTAVDAAGSAVRPCPCRVCSRRRPM